MRWNEMLLGKKIMLGFFAVLLIFLATAAIALDQFVAVRDNAVATAAKANASMTLYMREIDHLKWAQNVSAFVFDPAKTELNVATDGHLCAFGKWYYGEERKKLEELVPQLKGTLSALEGPHANLHKTAAEIFNLRKENRQKDVVEVFNGRSLKLLEEVQAGLKSLRDTLEKEVAKDQQDRDAGIRTSITVLVVSSILGVGAGILLSLLLSRSISGPIGRLAQASKAIAAGNLEAGTVETRGDEIGELSRSMGVMVESLKEKIAMADAKSRECEISAGQAQAALREAERKEAEISAMLEAMNQTAAAAGEIAERLNEYSGVLLEQVTKVRNGSEDQKKRLSEAAVAMNQMAATVAEVAKNASSAAQNASQAQSRAQEGAGVVTRTVSAMQSLNELAVRLKQDMAELGVQAASIGQVMNVISDIADQTNLLALNAAIEAARAGDAGRGFAVVADEVRKLAEKTMNATHEVGDKIQTIQQSVNSSVANVDQAAEAISDSHRLAMLSGESLRTIVDLAGVNDVNVQGIASAAEQQSAASEQINCSIIEVNGIAEHTQDDMAESVRIVDELARMAHELGQVIERLRSIDSTAVSTLALH